MCLLCVEIQKDKMTFKEVYSAMGEFIIPDDHKKEVIENVKNKYGSDSAAKIFGQDALNEGAD